MLVLALDTTTRRGSITLARDGAVVATFEGDAAITHGERLPGDLQRLVDAHGCRIADVDLFAVASGPGSFTGLRIGIATMQGLALANDKPLAGISALDALNETVSPRLFALSPRDEVAAWMDAQRGQVFSAVYRHGEVAEAALVDTPADILARWMRDGRHPAVFAGDGALAYRDVIRGVLAGAHVVDPLPPLAPSIAMLATAELRRQRLSPADAIRPIYIRRSDAELARDRKADLKVSTTTDRSSADL
jgi:tRNA threonylcarbamoyladenosine biosynthesis protein TsaB